MVVSRPLYSRHLEGCGPGAVVAAPGPAKTRWRARRAERYSSRCAHRADVVGAPLRAMQFAAESCACCGSDLSGCHTGTPRLCCTEKCARVRRALLNPPRRRPPTGQRPGRPGKLLDPHSLAARHRAGEPITRIAKSLRVHGDRVKAVLLEAGVPLRRGAWGEYHPRWRGGRRTEDNGYVRITLARDDPLRCMGDNNRGVFEHRYVMAQALGRPLRAAETVHHLDGDHGHNALENLQLRFGAHGEGIVLHCSDCGSRNLTPAPL